MTDLEDNKIFLADIPNPNVLICGRSGQGKTWYCCRQIEEAYEAGKNVLIIDYSGSYTEQELTRNAYKYLRETQVFHFQNGGFGWVSKSKTREDSCAELADALISVLGIESYYQKKWLRKGMLQHFRDYNIWSIPRFIGTLERIYGELKQFGGEKDDFENIKHLLTRISPYENLDRFYFKREEKDIVRSPISIMQISNFPDMERTFLTNLLITLLWKEVSLGDCKKCDTVVLDEFQHLAFEPGSAFYCILREGRKYGLQVVLSSQFVSHYEKERMETLLQVGNILIFRPTDRDRRFFAGIIDQENVNQWHKVLGTLNVGEAVLKGNYRINEKQSICTLPIICKI